MIREGCILTSPAKPIGLIIDALTKLNKGISAAVANEDPQLGLLLLTEQTALVKQVEEEFLPLARSLGVKEAARLWGDRMPLWGASLFKRSDPQHLAFLRTLASDPDLSEAMGNAMQVMMQGPLLAEAQRRKGMLSQISSLEHELQQLRRQLPSSAPEDEGWTLTTRRGNRGGRAATAAPGPGGRHSFAALFGGGGLTSSLPPRPRPPSRAASSERYGSEQGDEPGEVTSPSRHTSTQQMVAASAAAAAAAAVIQSQQQQHQQLQHSGQHHHSYPPHGPSFYDPPPGRHGGYPQQHRPPAPQGYRGQPGPGAGPASYGRGQPGPSYGRGQGAQHYSRPGPPGPGAGSARGYGRGNQ